MDLARTELPHDARMPRRDVTDVRREAVAWKERVQAAHGAITDDLGDDRGGSDRSASLVAVDDRNVLRSARPKAKTVHEARLGGRRQSVKGTAETSEIRAVEALAVDLARRDHLHRDARRAPEDGPEELLPVPGADLLRVVQLRKRPNAMIAKRFVIEDNARDDERPGERASAGLVSPGDVASAEPSVEPQ